MWKFFFVLLIIVIVGAIINLILIHHDIRILSILKRLNNKSPNTDEEQMDYWRCSCGVVNSKYTTACECGKTRSEIMDKTAKERDEFKKSLLKNGGWKCTCGIVHPNYVTSCGCGKSKEEVSTNKK